MRLTQDQVKIIKTAVQRHFGSRAEVRLFGSRTDDEARGGDIDLYIASQARTVDEALQAEIDLWVELQHQLGERRIDLLVDHPGMRERPAIFDVARTEGIVL